MEYLDVRDMAQVEKTVAQHKPDILFHLAAETDVDKSEIEIQHAYMTNTMGTENVALTCQKEGIDLVYISTAGVFDGEKAEPYIEFDTPNPGNVYGKTKWEGERIIMALLTRYYIVRAGWMIGGKEKDKKFVAKIIKLMEEKDELIVVNDKFGSPTFTKDFSKCLVTLLQTGRYGTYHMTNQGTCSRYEVACKIKEYLGRDDVSIKPVTSASFPLPAPRVRSEAMDNFKLHLLGLDTMRHWEEALFEYVTASFKPDFSKGQK
jgi:dTDP-4-dehydrorhamnose reductase